MENVFEMLKKRAQYIHRLRDNTCWVHELYGAARMALELDAINLEEFLTLNSMIVFGKSEKM